MVPSRTIVERLRAGDRPTFSFEYFPPKDEAGVVQLRDTITSLRPLAPDWVSITYGATGSSRDKTFAAVESIHELGHPRTMGHLTIAGQTRAEVAEALATYERLGVRQILAVRGDPPGGGAFVPPRGGLSTATELVTMVRAAGDFTIGVAAFPDGHPEGSPELDVACLLAKEEAGAEFAVTQLFFSVDAYLRLVDRFRRLGGTMPIVAGIMPVTVPSQIERFASLSGARMPPAFEARLRAVADDRAAFREVGIELMTRLCDDLLVAGAPGLQFFTLNRSKATSEILASLRQIAPRPR